MTGLDRTRLPVRRKAAVLLALVVTAVTVAEPPRRSQSSFTTEFLSRFDQVIPGADQMDWEKEYAHVERAIQQVWEQNGWDDPADEYARELAGEIARIPPWEPLRRLDRLGRRLALRYGLNAEETLTLQRAILRETGRVLGRHAGVIMQQVQEGFRWRNAGHPFTPDQVARWTKSAAPLLHDVRQSVERLVAEVEPMLDEEHLERLRADLRSYEKRRDYVDRMARKWANGQWQAEDWGLSDDPIQKQAEERAAARASAEAPAGPIAGADQSDTGRPHDPQRPSVAAPDGRGRPRLKPDRCVSFDPKTWTGCLATIEARYGLDPGQITTAQSIHAELLERADAYLEAHQDTLAAVPLGERAEADAYAPIRALHDELIARLEALPTTAQRRQANR